ncbi:MAG: PAS domain S-box protein [Candidatus Hermodarchaeota archaeon]
MVKKESDSIFSNKEFIETINNLNVIYFRAEFKGKLLFHNTALNRLLGLDPSIDLTRSPSSHFLSDSKVKEKYYEELEKKGDVKDFVVKIKNPKGDFLYIQLNSHFVKINGQRSNIVEGTAIDITEKYHLEEDLKETENRFNLIANNTNDLIAILNKDFEHIYINEKAYYSVLGYRKEEILGKRPRDFSHPDDLKRVSKSLKNGFLKGELLEEYRTRHKNGDYIWIELKGQFLTENGKITGAILISRDITKRKETEYKLKQSEEKYRSMIEDAQEGVWALDDHENTIIINTRICEMLGYTRDEMMGRNLHSFIPESMEPIVQGNRSKREKGIKETYEFQLLKKDGTIIYTEVSAAPIFDEDQNYKGSFAYITDITEEKKAIQKIQESENKYRTLFESSTDGIYSTDMEGRFIEVNRAFLEMIGYSRKEILEMHNRQITPEKWYENEDNNLLTQLSIGESKVYEKEFMHKNGSTLPVSIRFWILQDEQGDPSRIWAIVRDITERKQMENTLKEINRLKSEFLRRASHELKTPLVSIKGFSELILSNYSEDLNPNIISNLEEINKGCERLQSIINNLLQTSKLESTELKPKLEREDLSFLIYFCAEELHPIVAKREHSINIEIPETIITEFEKEEIHDVISNLLLNAIKYTPPKGWIDIKAEISEDFVVVSIKDNGIGFTEEEKNKIFQQFGKIERYGQGLDLGIDGSGLGLYISKKIVEAHGGQIWMESEGRNKGSTFYFSLPLVKD